MLIIYVKHYLNEQGIDYLKKSWFPKVHSLLQQQAGFISIMYMTIGDCVDITLKFEDEKTFDAWCAVPEHDQLLEELNPYRSRDYFKAVRTDHELADPSTLNWETY